MKIFKILGMTLAAALLLAGCGGGGTLTQSTTTTSGSGATGTDPVATVTVTSSAPTIPADDSATATITALVLDANNNLLANVPVTFTATSGGIAGSPATTTAAGAATVTLSAAGDPTLRTITVTATAAGIAKTVQVQVVPGGTNSTTVSLGSGTGAAFQTGIIGIGTASLSAGGSTSITVSLQQSNGTLYTQSTEITFSSPCQAGGLATITGTGEASGTATVTTLTGTATATYSANGCSGADVITATANVGGNALSATGTVTVAAAAVGSIVFTSATPTNVSIKGAGANQTSTVVFTVYDTSGGPRAGATVNFTLDTSVGGIQLAPATGTTGANGQVQTVVQSGTVATAVRVTATVAGVTPTISTQSSELTITTGIPTQNAFSIAVQPCPNVEAFNIDGAQVTVTVRMADRFSNPVPDGTAVTFSTQGGSIGGQCTTGTQGGESGFCSVTWTSQDPRPAGSTGHPAGRSSILATAIGEESFIDANGNGEYDTGETFFDRAERFRDDADMTNDNFDTDTGYVLGDFYYDFNNNQVRDPADGIFEGVLCNAGLPVCDPTKTSTGVGKRTLVIMSTSGAQISGPANVTLPHGTSGQLVYQIQDLNGNPIPWDATVTATTTGSPGTIAPSSFTQGCTFGRGPTNYAFLLTAGSSASSGAIQITVKTASGRITQYTTAVTIT
jgi:hypothetical protein